MDLPSDVVIGWYLATASDIHISNTLFAKVVQSDTLESRCHKYGIHNRSSHALFSALLPDNFYRENISEGILTQGQLRLHHLKSIYKSLCNQYGRERAQKFSTDLCIIVEWLNEHHRFNGRCTKRAK